MYSPTGLPCVARLGVALFTVLLLLQDVSCQTHQWKNHYGSCSVECGGGVQLLQKNCYTTDVIPKPALPHYCNSIPVLEVDVIACNTFPCDMCERTFDAPSGVITSPYFPDKYSVPKYCRLTVTLPVDNRVLIRFTEFVLEGLNLAAYSHLQESSLCLCGTLVQLSDVNTPSRSNTYCGTKQPFSWMSDSNSVLLEFLTESSHLFNRFKAEYTTIIEQPSCYEIIDLTRASKGNVASPDFPNKYTNNIHCEYLLHADPINRIVLTILDFQLEPSPDCDLDFLSIEDLFSRRRKVFCGTLHKASWTSDSNEILLTFHTNFADVYQGFALLYETVDRAPEGSQLFTEPEGTITSPGYPLAYPASTKAHYRICVDPAMMVVVKFTDFHTERNDDQEQPIPLPRVNKRSTLDVLQYDNGDPCRTSDRIEIEDYLQGASTMYCGKLPPFTWFSRTNEVVIRFTSDADENYKGFSATYRTIEKRPAPNSELVFRAASVTETDVNSKWLDTSQGYAENNPSAQSLYKNSPLTFKDRHVNRWQDYGVRRVGVVLYKDGVIVAAFYFKNDPTSTISSWFRCENLIYSTYTDLLDIDCSQLVFTNGGGNFAITDVAGSTGTTCNNPSARLWLDVQDKVSNPSSPSVCQYERSASQVAKFFYSTSNEAGLTASGTNIATADVMTIWIRRDCDESIELLTGRIARFQSEGFGSAPTYRNNEYCDYYFQVGPFDRILLHFVQFSLEHQDDCSKDYVEVEDLTTGRTDRFCGNQRAPLFTTDGNAALVRFRTDSYSAFPGWSAEASLEGRNNEDCSSILTSTSGNLTNADYPSALTQFRLQGCETLLHVGITDRVTASFNKVIVDLADCPEFTILDHVSATPVIEVSGSVLPFSWTSTSNELILWYCTSLPYRSYLYYEGNYRATISPKPATCAQYRDAEFPGVFVWPSTQLATGIQNCYIIIRTHPVLNLRIVLTLNNLVLKDRDCISYIESEAMKPHTYRYIPRIIEDTRSISNAVTCTRCQTITKITDTTTQRSDKTCETARQAFTWTSDANEVIVQFFSASFSFHAVDGRYSSSPRPKLSESRTFTGMEGSFTSPNYPETYPSNTHMEYLLHGKAHEIVFVNFVELDLELPSTTPVARPRGKRDASYDHLLYKRQAVPNTMTACEYDYIEIKDNLDPRRNVKYCGNQLPFSWVSSGNEAIVELITDGSVEKKGFKAEYIFRQRQDPTGCGDIFETSAGSFVSPSYPRDYPPNSDCTYVILALASKRIKITFTSFNTEEDLKCEKDSVEVADKLTDKTDRYCSNLATPFVWTSNSNLVFVVFRSDSQTQFGGFTANYVWEDRPEKTVCQYNFNEATGEIISPRSSGLYPNLKECYYDITIQPGFGIQLTFVEFVLEDPDSNDKCEFDYLQIIDGASGSSEKLCGSRSPFERLITSNHVQLVFKSDFIAYYKGFTVKYEQVDLTTRKPGCDRDLSSPSGAFVSPNYPANYPLNTECRYNIVVASGSRIKITFMDFNLEGFKDCPFDFVQVTDLGDGTTDKFCGRKTSEFSWLSGTHDVSVLFVSDDRTPSTGFAAEYVTEAIPTQPAVVTGCDSSYGMILTEPTGKLTSPNYPYDYPLSKDCKVTITVETGKICEITFTEFKLENHKSCGYDYLQLTSIPDGDSLTICGTQATPFTWKSTSNTCEIIFSSDDYVPAKGYRARYEAIDVPLTIASDCIQDLTGMEGDFTSPNFPSDYDLKSDCTTTITVPAGYKVHIIFKTFDVEFHKDCDWDWVQITDLGTNVATEKLCGNRKDDTYDSDSNSVAVRFFSDAYEVRQGYSATYTAKL